MALTGWGVAPAHWAASAELQDGWAQLYSGNYTQCIALARQAIQDDRYQEEWRLMLGERS